MSNVDEVKAVVEKAALENAIKFEGKANPKALVGKVMGQFAEYRTKRDEAVFLVNEIVDTINALSLAEQKAKLDSLGGATAKKAKPSNTELKELTNAVPGNVVMRFAPSPSGPMHIGHAITGGLSSLYVKKYGGKFIFRIEDTNADNIDPTAYDMLVRDAKWIFGNVDEVVIQSDRLPIYYEYAERLIKKGVLYIDTTDPEEFREYVSRKEDVPDKALSAEEHMARWSNMLNGTIKKGDAVVRIKSDMAHPNPAMRDFPLFRINETPHPKQGTKYRVWPLMNFSVFVDDYTFGLTHIIRAKDHTDNAKRQELLFEAIGAKPPVSYFTGRYKFEGIELSSSKTRALIEDGTYDDWNDIRIPFLEPLRRRGYHPMSLLTFAQEIGLSKVDKKMEAADFFAKLDSNNKNIIDSTTKRLFFVENPHELEVSGLNKNAELDLLPEGNPKNITGGRKFSIADSVLIEKADFANILTGVVTRLADLCNVVDSAKTADDSYDSFKSIQNKGKIIHWLPTTGNVDVTIRLADNSVKKGVAEIRVSELEIGEVIQFERFGFCRLDSIEENVYNFWFGHK